MEVQWLGLSTFTAVCLGSILGWELRGHSSQQQENIILLTKNMEHFPGQIIRACTKQIVFKRLKMHQLSFITMV